MTGRELRAVWYESTATAESCSAQDLTAWIQKMGREPDAFGLYRNEFDGTQTHERDFSRRSGWLLEPPAALLQELVDAWPQFDGDFEEDINVSGADMVDWVCQYRERVKATLAREGTS